MPQDRIEADYFSADIREFITWLHRYGVRYVVVGGEAVIHYGHARLTGDIDFFFEPAPDNARALYDALLAFWSGHIPGLHRAEELLEPGIVLQFGQPPNRIDLMNQIDGVTFAEAWATRQTVELETPTGAVPLHYLSRQNLIRNKEAAGRPKDLEDLAYLRAQR